MLCPKGRVGSTPTTGTSAVREEDQGGRRIEPADERDLR